MKKIAVLLVALFLVGGIHQGCTKFFPTKIHKKMAGKQG